LIAFGGNNAGVVAAVLVFRFMTIVPTLILGTVAAAFAAPLEQRLSRHRSRHSNRSTRDRHGGRL
jgi:hypothetical protein